jgi:hypothetical protein
MKLKSLLLLPLAILSLAACDDSKSYSELLEDEDKAVNSFLANQKVINEIPADTVFETGEDAPYYRIEPEGNVYMQVINAGDRKNNRVEDDQKIYFRYGRISLLSYAKGNDDALDGNYDDINYLFFRFNNYQLPSSYAYGEGIQMPLNYLGIDCEVNLVIKSKFGFYDEQSNVIPYKFHVKYYKSKI